MKIFRFLIPILLMLSPLSLMAQQTNDTESTDEKVYTIVESMPSYPGGQEELSKYLGTNIRYPESALQDRVEGVVYVQFTVDTDGSVINSKVLRGIHADCDGEALRVVNSMPKWNPGKQNGKYVKVVYNLPIRFKFT